MKEFSKTTHTPLSGYQRLILNGDDIPLPGHLELDLVKDTPTYLSPTPKNARHAAVVLMIHATAGHPSLLFIERTSHFGHEKHRGQIAFPGGKLEPNESLKECAFREMDEEIGIRLSPDHPVKALTPLYVSVSNFLIHPFVAIQDTIPAPTPNPEEVSAIIDSPLTEIRDRYSIHRKNIHVRDRVLKNVPHYTVGGRTLWGATALIFAEFLQLVEQNR